MLDPVAPPRPDLLDKADRDARDALVFAIASIVLELAWFPAHVWIHGGELAFPLGGVAGWMAILRANAARAGGSRRPLWIKWARGIGILTGIVVPVVLLALLVVLVIVFIRSDWTF